MSKQPAFRYRLIYSVAIVATSLACCGSRAQGQKVAADQKKSQQCVIEGAVVRAEDSVPLKKAFVVLHADNDHESKPYRTRTDADGKFSFASVAPGRYRLIAGHTGFLTQSYGERSPDSGGMVVALASGQHMKDILFRLIRQAVITGRVVDEDGEPVVSAQVTAERKAYSDGKLILGFGGEQQTDDQGEYRIFDLGPGTYYLRVSPPNSNFANFTQTTDDAQEAYLPIFFPGTTDPAQAQPLEVHAGDELRANLTLVPVHGVTIKGRVINAVPGESANFGAEVSLHSRTSVAGESVIANAFAGGPEGEFEMHGIPPGSYFLDARIWNAPEHTGHYAQQSLEVGTGNIEGIRLVVMSGVSIPGRVQVESGQLPTSERIAFALQSVGEGPYRGSSCQVKADGSFTFKEVAPGRYKVRFWQLSQEFYAKAIRLGGDDVLAKGLTITSGQKPQLLEIVLSRAVSNINGVVMDDDITSAGVTVVAVPEERLRQRFDLYKSTTTDQYGRFALAGLAPGEYKLFAWRVIESRAYEDPDFIKKFEDDGTRVEVQEYDRKSVTLKLIPADAQSTVSRDQ